MVIGAFPIAKLSVLLVKQISRPIANYCRDRAKSHPFFRTYVCMPPAQFYNWCEVKLKMWVLNLGKPVNIPVLSQEMAIELGANLLGESVIFIIGASLILIEYSRQVKKESAKEAKKQEEMNRIMSTLTDLYFTVQQHQTQLRELERVVVSIGGKPVDIPDKVPIDPPKLTPSEPEKSKEPDSLSKQAAPPKEEDLPECEPKSKTPKTSETTPQKVVFNANYNENSINNITPYPNNGFILKSLNYIQMDASSKLFFSQNLKTKEEVEVPQKANPKIKYEPGLLTETLKTIEINCRSLF